MRQGKKQFSTWEKPFNLMSFQAKFGQPEGKICFGEPRKQTVPSGEQHINVAGMCMISDYLHCQTKKLLI